MTQKSVFSKYSQPRRWNSKIVNELAFISWWWMFPLFVKSHMQSSKVCLGNIVVVINPGMTPTPWHTHQISFSASCNILFNEVKASWNKYFTCLNPGIWSFFKSYIHYWKLISQWNKNITLSHPTINYINGKNSFDSYRHGRSWTSLEWLFKGLPCS